MKPVSNRNRYLDVRLAAYVAPRSGEVAED